MPDEQAGTAEVESGAPVGGAVAPAQVAQPETAAKVEPAATPAGPNWDDPTNPYRQRYHGLEGNFKQLKAERDAIQRQLHDLDGQRQQWETERQRIALLRQDEQLDQLLSSEDPEEVVSKLKVSREQQRVQQQTLETWQREHAPRLYQQAQAALLVQHEQAERAIAEQFGLSSEDVEAVVRASRGSYAAFKAGIFGRALEQRLAAERKKHQEELAEARKATRNEALGKARAGESSPDTNTGGPVADDDSFIEAFAAGKSNDLKRAAQVLGIKL